MSSTVLSNSSHPCSIFDLSEAEYYLLASIYSYPRMERDLATQPLTTLIGRRLVIRRRQGDLFAISMAGEALLMAIWAVEPMVAKRRSANQCRVLAFPSMGSSA